MSISSFNRLIGKVSGKYPLSIVITIPFLLQIVTAVGLVGYLSFRNGQKTVNELANQLMTEVSNRIEQNLNTYMNIPHQINKSKLDTVKLGLLDMQNLQPWEKLLWRQVQSYPHINFTSIANKNGEYRTGEKLSDGSLMINISGESTNFDFFSYNTNNLGEKTTIAQRIKNFDIRQHPSYQDAISSKKPNWSSVYVSFLEPTLIVSALLPVYDRKNQLEGVLITALRLDGIGNFLNSLKIGKSGKSFIVDRNGTLLATSTWEKPFIIDGNERTLFNATESSEKITKETAKYLKKQFGNFNKIPKWQKLHFEIKGQRQFLQVQPFKDGKGLDWLIVVVVPENDFMERINANTRVTIILCLITLIIATITCIFTARWIIKPLLLLNIAAHEIARGELEQNLDLERSDEIGQLAKSFKFMAWKLQISFKDIQAQKNAAQRFVPHHFLEFLHKGSIVDIQLGNHVSKEMAVMFSDIRSFTSISENMTPQENFDFVNAYLSRVSPKIRDFHGFIVKYLGDGMMAIFPNGADDAIQAAIAKLRTLEQYNIRREKEGFQAIKVGIGIHFGLMMVGIVGETARMQGDALSDNVNLTARLESLTKFYGASLIISEDALNNLEQSEKYKIRFLDIVLVKGKQKPISIYEIYDGETQLLQDLKLQTQTDFQQGIEYYKNQEFLAAKGYFEQVLAINPNDITASLYLQRISQLISQGKSNNWTGVWTWTQK
jgi:class 3 adenylate cyclase